MLTAEEVRDLARFNALVDLRRKLDPSDPDERKAVDNIDRELARLEISLGL